MDPLFSQWVMYFPAFPPSTFINYHYPYLDYTARSPKALSCCLATPSIHSMQKSPGMNKPRVTKAVHPIPSQHSWIKGTEERRRPSCGPDMSCACTYGDHIFFLVLLPPRRITLLYKTYIFLTTKLTRERRLSRGTPSEEPAVLKGVCKWNSQSKKLTERARHLSWRLHSLKARTFWMHFKNMGVYHASAL